MLFFFPTETGFCYLALAGLELCKPIWLQTHRDLYLPLPTEFLVMYVTMNGLNYLSKVVQAPLPREWSNPERAEFCVN